MSWQWTPTSFFKQAQTRETSSAEVSLHQQIHLSTYMEKRNLKFFKEGLADRRFLSSMNDDLDRLRLPFLPSSILRLRLRLSIFFLSKSFADHFEKCMLFSKVSSESPLLRTGFLNAFSSVWLRSRALRLSTVQNLVLKDRFN